MKKRMLISAVSLVLALAICGCGAEKVKDKEVSMALPGEKIGTTVERKGTYTGEVKEGKPNGNGRFDTVNSRGNKWYYEGNFVNGKMEGKGKQEWPSSKQVFEGTFKDNDIVEGKKSWVDNNNVSYSHEGTFNPAGLHGKGKVTITAPNGQKRIYEGNFTNGSITEGKMIEGDKVTYEGAFDGGRPAMKPVSMGTELNYMDWDYKVNYAKKVGKVMPTAFNSIQTSGVFVVVSVDATNKNFSKREIGGNFFVLYDEKGRVFEANTEASLGYHHATKNRYWHLSTVNPSMKVEDVCFAFEVPEDVTNLRMLPNGAFGKVAPILLDVK